MLGTNLNLAIGNKNDNVKEKWKLSVDWVPEEPS